MEAGMQSPMEAFKDPELWEKLATHPDTRPHIVDTGFRKTVERLRDDNSQQAVQAAMKDPRVMQALMALQGMRLSVTSDDIKRAERVGDMPKRDAVQTSDLEVAYKLQNSEEAKAAGNDRFKAGEWSTAIACWMQSLSLMLNEARAAREEGEYTAEAESADAARCATLNSNCAAAHLKLNRPHEALKACESALEVAPAGTDTSKSHFRMAQAHEALTAAAANPAAALKEAELAVQAVERAFAAADEAAKAAGEVGASSVRHMQREVQRLKALESKARGEAEARRVQDGREAKAAALRQTGVQLPTEERPRAARGGSTATGGAAEAETSSGGSSETASRGPWAPTPGYVQERDLSFWAEGWLASELPKLKHSNGAGCVITVTALNKSQSDIHASIKQKRDKASLFYDLTLIINWRGTSTLQRKTDGKMEGIMRMYNIGQDTRYNPGGDKETSFMYELGFPRDHFGQSEPWAEQIKAEAAELFHMVGELLQRWSKELVAKAAPLLK